MNLAWLPGAERKRSGSLRVAAVATEYRPWSHADVILGRLIQGYALDVAPRWPDVQLRALYIDQFPSTDLSRALSKQYGFPIVPTIREAILDTSGKLDVDGVLLIGEHGNYPTNDREQTLYPRRRFFEETVAAFEAAGEVAPVFNDKHLAARWEDAKWMYEKAKALKIPFMAGSSVPLSWRRPWLEIPLGARIDEALSVGYAGLEAYGFHALETLQCMVERRQGGEAGVTAVQCVEGPAVWEAMRAGRFSRELLAAALRCHEPLIDGDFETRCPNPAAYFIEHADGFRSTCLMLNPLAGGFLFAARLAGDVRPVASQFWLEEPVFGHFGYLTHAILEMVRTGKPQYPVERTVLTTGILSAVMDSRFEKGRRIETPDLKIPYQAVDHDLGAYRHPLAANGRDGGWIELFNRRDLAGWSEIRPAASSVRWEVVDGVLLGRDGAGTLVSLEEFGEFELFAELRGTGPEGAVALSLRTRPFVEPPVVGVEIRCPSGSWMTLRVRAAGGRFHAAANGLTLLDRVQLPTPAARGAVALRLLEPTARLEVRELRIRRV